MPWKMIGEPELMLVTNASAEAHFLLPKIHDRPLNPIRLRHHLSALQNNCMRPIEWAMAFCEEDGRWYRVNGQHTSCALKDNADIPKNSKDKSKGRKKIYAYMTKYLCATTKDVEELWSQFDAKISSRSVGDMAGGVVATIPELSEYANNSGVINRVVAGLWISNDPESISSSKLSDWEKAESIYKNIEVFLWVVSIIGKGPKAPLTKNAVIAAMISTYRIDPSAATKFWADVRDGKGKIELSPIRDLKRWIMEQTNKKSYNGQSTHGSVYYAYCILRWNSWRRKTKKVPDNGRAKEQHRMVTEVTSRPVPEAI